MITVTQIFRFLKTTLIFLIIGYLVIAFIKYDMNPNNWKESERASILLFGCLGWIINFMNKINFNFKK